MCCALGQCRERRYGRARVCKAGDWAVLVDESLEGPYWVVLVRFFFGTSIPPSIKFLMYRAKLAHCTEDRGNCQARVKPDAKTRVSIGQNSDFVCFAWGLGG